MPEIPLGLLGKEEKAGTESLGRKGPLGFYQRESSFERRISSLLFSSLLFSREEKRREEKKRLGHREVQIKNQGARNNPGIAV